jgi:hypothetical protein
MAGRSSRFASEQLVSALSIVILSVRSSSIQDSG